MWNLKRNGTYALAKEKETHKLKNKLMVAGGGRRIGEEFGSLGSTCTHCYI